MKVELVGVCFTSTCYHVEVKQHFVFCAPVLNFVFWRKTFFTTHHTFLQAQLAHSAGTHFYNVYWSLYKPSFLLVQNCFLDSTRKNKLHFFFFFAAGQAYCERHRKGHIQSESMVQFLACVLHDPTRKKAGIPRNLASLTSGQFSVTTVCPRNNENAR